MEGQKDPEASTICGHCNGRPACAPHPCPLNLESGDCTCCGGCSKICADMARHLEVHTPALMVDPLTGEMFISYVLAEGAEDDPPGPDDGYDAGGWDVGMSA